jgi:hypothetical protein
VQKAIVIQTFTRKEKATVWSSFDKFIRKPVQYTPPESPTSCTDITPLIVGVGADYIGHNVVMSSSSLSSSSD